MIGAIYHLILKAAKPTVVACGCLKKRKRMPDYSNLELNVNYSQVLGSMDSVSVPSEPLDIRNWFSSYAYESPELNTLDDFQDFDGSTGFFVEEGKKAKLGDAQSVDKSDDGLLSGKMASLDRIVKCNESDNLEHNKSTAVVLGSSESLSLCSEPPDIKNWFSSYLYETPLPGTIDDFTIPDYKEGEEGNGCNAENINKESDKDVRVLMDAGENTELLSHSRISALAVKCTNLVKGTELNKQSSCKDDHKVDPNPMSDIFNELISEKVSQQMLPVQKSRTSNHGSVKEFTKANADGNKNNTKSDSMFIHKTSHRLLNMKNYTGTQEGKFPPKSIGMKDYAKESLEKEDHHINDNSWRRPTTARSLGKENSDAAFPEDGFVSTRRRANAENQTRPHRVPLESPRKGIKAALNHEKKTSMSRQILSETTNFHLPNAVEITGKWHCPQKNKPNLSPPLKQLRMEHWIRRF